MKVLGIETSCDETAIAIVRGESVENGTTFTILGNALLSQIDIHREFGGVFPALAKREHAKNIVPVLSLALQKANLLEKEHLSLSQKMKEEISTLLEREPELTDVFLTFIETHKKPDIDAIAVTSGPGLEPALWVGVNVAEALARAWHIPLVPVNHMEGHIVSALAKEETEHTLSIRKTPLPMLALLISGGHTELVLMKTWLSYELIGQTKDDAIGEAFDKVARMIGLPYPGGPEISKLAEKARAHNIPSSPVLPRPMTGTPSCDFSYAGLKTSVLYHLKKHGDISETEKEALARSFEDAATDVLITKTRRALEETSAQTLVLGGGVSANTHIRRTFSDFIEKEMPHVALFIPKATLTTDNAVMIGLAGYYRAVRGEYAKDPLRADGNLALAPHLSHT